MNKLPLKYQGVTQGEWKMVLIPSCYPLVCDKDGMAVADTDSSMAGPNWCNNIEVAKENATLMADSKRLAGAVVELRERLAALVGCIEGFHAGDTDSPSCIAARNALTQTAEWAA